ncbi:MAG: cytidylate kinase family protein [Chitinophagales bacterium]|nr:cytidylate kinase family protein [Chitinophagales bacterium]
MLNIPSGTKITITGDLGSGKSVVSKILCERTGFEYISTGRVQRQLAQELGIDTLEMNRLADTDPTIDERIDGIFVALGKDPKGYIIDSRMAWFFLPNSFKIFLQTDVEVAVQRIMNDPNRDSEQYSSPTEAAQKILARKASENARFLAKYGADCANLNNFDLVINTANRTQAQVAEVIFEVLEGRQEGREMKRFW